MPNNETVSFTVKIKKRTVKVLLIILSIIAALLLRYPVESVVRYFAGYSIYAHVLDGVADPKMHVDRLVADLNAKGIDAELTGITVGGQETIGVKIRESHMEKAVSLDFASDKSIWEISTSSEYGPFVYFKNRMSDFF